MPERIVLGLRWRKREMQIGEVALGERGGERRV